MFRYKYSGRGCFLESIQKASFRLSLVTKTIPYLYIVAIAVLRKETRHHVTSVQLFRPISFLDFPNSSLYHQTTHEFSFLLYQSYISDFPWTSSPLRLALPQVTRFPKPVAPNIRHPNNPCKVYLDAYSEDNVSKCRTKGEMFLCNVFQTVSECGSHREKEPTGRKKAC